MSQFPRFVKIVEVGPRDGLQNIKNTVPTEIKIDFINQLSLTGLPVIETTSFVSPRWIPQLSDHSEVYRDIKKKKNVQYPVLIPNIKGYETARSAGVRDIAVFTTPSEAFSQQNTHCSVSESLERIQEILIQAKADRVPVRAYLSCVLGCPYSGEVSVQQVADLAYTLWQMGCEEISLGDTIGVGTPFKTMQLIEAVVQVIPIEKIAVHFHDTYGQALANIYAALSLGVHIVDASVAGLGGCPYAKGAAGNVATEDVIYMLNGMGIETGVDLHKLVSAGRFICEQINQTPQSKVNIALQQSNYFLDN